ncbi:MAG: 3-hexulose-6-phosphate synthase [Geminicoccaceae bacterium]
MKLQLALDDISLSDALRLVEQIEDCLDIVEIGTPMIIEEGLAPVRAMKARFPGIEVLADLKIMDAGALESRQGFAAGADYVTVLGVTDLATIEGCLGAAEQYGRTVVVDMICVADMAQRIAQLERIGVRALAVHTGVDQQAAGRTPLDDLKLMKAHSAASRIFVAGGITLATLPHYLAEGADVAIVGGGICQADDPVRAARELHELITAHGVEKPR